MVLHIVSPSKGANVGLPSGMAALCTDNCTSRLHRNLRYRAEKNVVAKGRNYRKRYIFDEPEKREQKYWLGCYLPAGPDYSDQYWDCEIYDNGYPFQYVESIATINDLGQITHLNPQRGFGRGRQLPPYFYYREGARLVRGETGLTIIFTEKRNDKLMFRDRHLIRSNNCARVNVWHGCKAVPRIDLTGGNQTITQWLNYEGGFDFPVFGFGYSQIDAVSGIANGFKWFPFLPPTNASGWYFVWQTNFSWDEGRAPRGVISMTFRGFGGSYSVFGSNVVPFEGMCNEPIDFSVRMGVFGPNPFNPPFVFNLNGRLSYETL